LVNHKFCLSFIPTIDFKLIGSLVFVGDESRDEQNERGEYSENVGHGLKSEFLKKNRDFEKMRRSRIRILDPPPQSQILWTLQAPWGHSSFWLANRLISLKAQPLSGGEIHWKIATHDSLSELCKYSTALASALDR
jgi:hypothetical protein